MQKSQSKFILFGIILSVVVFLTYYFIFEKTVHENRLTYSVSSEKYTQYVNALRDYYVDTGSHTVIISPNLESIADSLIDEGVRRFELKEFHSGEFSVDKIDSVYFINFLGIDPPSIERERFVGKSTPLKTSLGISLLLMCFTLLLDYFAFIKHRRSISRSKK